MPNSFWRGAIATLAGSRITGPMATGVLSGMGWMQRLVAPRFAPHPIIKMKPIFKTTIQATFFADLQRFTQALPLARCQARRIRQQLDHSKVKAQHRERHPLWPDPAGHQHPARSPNRPRRPNGEWAGLELAIRAYIQLNFSGASRFDPLHAERYLK